MIGLDDGEKRAQPEKDETAPPAGENPAPPSQ
jgi:hypothetical protein